MRTMQRSARVLAAMLLGALALWATPLNAEPWPQRMVRFIVPLPPGTSTDLVARLFAEKLSERWRQPVVAENRQAPTAYQPLADSSAGATTTRCCFHSPE
jgi:tripartite-type tricarboxylate transporter receptor subunit TctC